MLLDRGQEVSIAGRLLFWGIAIAESVNPLKIICGFGLRQDPLPFGKRPLQTFQHNIVCFDVAT
jgi:hypothetical protein